MRVVQSLVVSLLALMCLFAAPGPMQAQATTSAPGAPYTIQASAQLVVLDVVVTDRSGHVPRGLKPEDFRVREDGVEQKIVSFDAPGSHLPPASAVIGSTADLTRLAPLAPINVIVLDEFNTRFADISYARQQLKRYLESQPARLAAPTQLIAAGLFKYGVLQDFTQDREKLLHALDEHRAAYPMQVETGSWQAERYVRTFDALQRVALSNAAHQGHKNVVWVGGGLPRLSADTSGDSRSALDAYLRRMTNLLRDERITLYQVDPAGNPFTTFRTGLGLASANSNGGSLDAVNPFQGSLEFAALAEATGGKALIGRNDIDAEIATSIRDGGSMYTLAYRPTDREVSTTRFRRIQLIMAQDGLSASTRKGYFARDAMKKLVGDMLIVLLGTATFEDLPVEAVLKPGSRDVYEVSVKARDRDWVTEEGEGARHTDLLVLASSFDAAGKELDRVVKTFRDTQAASGAARFSFDLELKTGPNAVRTRVAVRIDESGRVGSADVVLRRDPE